MRAEPQTAPVGRDAMPRGQGAPAVLAEDGRPMSMLDEVFTGLKASEPPFPFLTLAGKRVEVRGRVEGCF